MAKTLEQIRFAVVGCGRIAQNHFAAIASHASQDVELTDVCDTDPVVLEATADKLGVPGHLSLDRLLASTSANCIVVATPSGLHSDQVVQIARSSRHAVTEKPMATRWKDGLRMVRACDEAGVSLFVVKQNRRNATLQLLKRSIERGRFGRIYSVAVNVFWQRPQSYYDSAKWRGTWEFDGGALMNQASHYIDLLDWMVGPVESVMAYTATLARTIEVEDTGVVALRWRSGALGTVNVTMLTYPKNVEGSITVLGERGSARIGGIAVNEIQLWDFADQDAEIDDSVASASYSTTSVYGHGHPLYYENVIKALRGEVAPETDGREGLRSLELLIAMYISARDRRLVSLPLEY